MVALAGCQQTPEQRAQAVQNIAVQTGTAEEALSLPAQACSQFLTTGALPASTLTAAGFEPMRAGFFKKIRPGSFAIPGGVEVRVSTSWNGSCSVNMTNTPFRLAFARNAVIGGLTGDGWSHEGNLIYSKGANRIKMTGGSAYGVTLINLLPL